MDKRNYLLFYCLLFFSIGCFGQKKAHIIIIGMPQRTFLTNKWDLEAKPLLRKVPSYSIAVGIMMRQEIKGRWYFNYGFIYSYQAQKLKMYFASLNGHKGKTVLSYLKLPLLFQYNLINRENSSFFIQVGPQVSMLVIEEGAIVKLTDIVEAGGGYKKFVLDGVISLGAEVKIRKNLFYNLQLRFDHSLHYSNVTDYLNIDGEGAPLIKDVLGNPRSGEHNMTIGLLNGISIKIR